jgi:hypothetical protein
MINKLQTANCKLQTANCKLQTANCKLQTANCKLQTANCKAKAVSLWRYCLSLHFDKGRGSGRLLPFAVGWDKTTPTRGAVVELSSLGGKI